MVYAGASANSLALVFVCALLLDCIEHWASWSLLVLILKWAYFALVTINSLNDAVILMWLF